MLVHNPMEHLLGKELPKWRLRGVRAVGHVVCPGSPCSLLVGLCVLVSLVVVLVPFVVLPP